MSASEKLSLLSLEERAGLSSGQTFWTTKSVPHAGIPAIFLADGPHGLRKQSGEANDHLGILEGEPATCFPPAVALGSSWDPALITEVGKALGREAKAKQVAVLLGPGINMKRDPRCGRNFEYFSEDPLHTGILASAFVAGVQSQQVGTSLKHFAANNQEHDRLRVSATIDERTLREIYLRAFERVVREQQPWTVMCSYNKINGTYASEHRWLLTEVLRDEWGFEGVVVSDWGAVQNRPAAISAGLDLEMPATNGRSDARLLEAEQQGEVSEAAINRSAERVIALAEKGAAGADPEATFDAEAHHALAREAARRSAVLLKNEGNLLPLDRTRGRIAVIGELARTPRYQGAGSSQIVPTKLDNALAELQRLSEGASVEFAAGYQLDGKVSGKLQREAVKLAKSADTVVLFLGLPDGFESEGFDREHLELPQNQLDLLAELTPVNQNLVVVLSAGGVVQLADWEQRIPAILAAWLLGQAGGGALADLLFGLVSPSGKLAETIPLRLEDTPAYLNFPGEYGTVNYGEGIFIGYRWYDSRKHEVSYPFGHGLSYTSFEYSALKVKSGSEGLEVQVTVKNTGSRAGRETVQLYLGLPQSRVTRPRRELKAFGGLLLEPGKKETLHLRVSRSDLSYFSTAGKGWYVEAGEYLVEVGASSRDIRASQRITIAGDNEPVELTNSSTLGDWMDSEKAQPIVQDLMNQIIAEQPDLGKMLNNKIMMKMARQMPIQQLVSFGVLGQHQLDLAVAKVNSQD